MGLSQSELAVLTEEERRNTIEKVRNEFLNAGADFVMETLEELPPLIEQINQLIEDGKRPNAK